MYHYAAPSPRITDRALHNPSGIVSTPLKDVRKSYVVYTGKYDFQHRFDQRYDTVPYPMLYVFIFSLP